MGSKITTTVSEHEGQARSGRTQESDAPADRHSPWAPRLTQLTPVALPKRFLEGVAWDEV